jgi:mannan endo-1,4-beta-mannosidase
MRRPSVPAILATVAVSALLGYTAFVVTRSSQDAGPGGLDPPGASSPSRSTAPPPTVFPPPGKVFLGVQTNAGPYDFTDVDAFAAATGAEPAALQFSQSWAHDQFSNTIFDRIADRRMLPILSWEPWDYALTGPARSSGEQPRYRLSRIASGEFDEYITSWAQGIKRLGYPVGMRFGHEMNGFWYPWCEQSNGNRKGDYVRAYRHIHQIFESAGATNVIWIWSPNVTYPSAEPLKGLYPGDRYVDWIGLSGYYGTAGVENYRSFNAIFTDTFAELRTFSRKPIVVTETGSTDASGQRARWVRQMFAQLPRHPDVIGVIWFETKKELDWRLASTPAAAKIFGAAAAQPRYRTPWSTNTAPIQSVRVPARG